MKNLVNSLVLAGSLLVGTANNGAYAQDTMKQLALYTSQAGDIVRGPNNTSNSGGTTITGKDLADKHIPKKFKDIVSLLLKKSGDGGELSILVESSSSNGNKKILENWLRKLKVPSKYFVRYPLIDGYEGRELGVTGSLGDVISDFSTRVIIITDKTGEDWDGLIETLEDFKKDAIEEGLDPESVEIISGVKIITFFINNNGLSCKDTHYVNRQFLGKDSICVDVEQ